jgi:hypothetical protein
MDQDYIVSAFAFVDRKEEFNAGDIASHQDAGIRLPKPHPAYA